MFDQTSWLHPRLICCCGGALTMLTGVLGAAAQHEFRRILSFHIVSQIGYMILGWRCSPAGAWPGRSSTSCTTSS
jgi:multicomponent Na+:H+ antiporter subunit D